jgi:hypothetical protein
MNNFFEKLLMRFLPLVIQDKIPLMASISLFVIVKPIGKKEGVF